MVQTLLWTFLAAVASIVSADPGPAPQSWILQDSQLFVLRANW